MSAGDSGSRLVGQDVAARDNAGVDQAGRDKTNSAGDDHAGAGPTPPAPGSLPPAPGELTGRDRELERLLGLLDPGGSVDAGVVVVSAVAGLAGVGTTALAVHAARQAVGRGWFPGGHLFLDLRGYEPSGQVPAGQALGALLREVCGAHTELPFDPAEQAGLYRSQMAAIARDVGAVLLVLDSASSAAQVAPLLPGGTGHRVLVTSRHTLGALPATLLGLAVLEPADAIAMVTRFLGGSDLRPGREPGALAVLAGHCGYLPLALQITAAGLRADPQRSLAGLAGDLRDERARLGLSYPEEGQTLAVRASFELSYRRLPADQARLFRLLSLNPTSEFSLDAVAALAGTPREQAWDTAAGLARARLMEPVTEDRWRMHDLIRVYAAEPATEPADDIPRREQDDRGNPEEEALGRLLGHYQETAAAADDHLRALPGRPVPERFRSRAEALAWLETEHANLVAAVTRTATTHPRTALTLITRLALYLNERRHFYEAVTTGHRALAAARRLGDRHGQGTALNILGVTLCGMRCFVEAVTVLEQAAGILRESGDRHAEGLALVHLGGALVGARRFREAVTVLEQAAGIVREAGDRHAEAMALDNLGGALIVRQRFRKAIAARKRAVDIFRETGDRHSEGNALHNLGTALRAIRRFEEAVTAHSKAADIFRETGNWYGEGNARRSLAEALVFARWSRRVRRLWHAASGRRAIRPVRDAAQLPPADREDG